MKLRSDIVIFIQKKTGLSELYSKDLEIGIYNWCIEYANCHNILKSWNNPKFKDLYVQKTRSCVSNLDPNGYLGNKDLIVYVNDKKILPHEVPFLKPENSFPAVWKKVIEERDKRLEHAFEDDQVAMTNMYKCGKCKNRKTTYYTLQIRSSDEAETIFVKCIVCKNSWRIG